MILHEDFGLLVPREQRAGGGVTILLRAIDPDNQPHVKTREPGEKLFGTGSFTLVPVATCLVNLHSKWTSAETTA